MTVTTSNVERVNDSERPSGQAKIAAVDLFVPATDSQGRVMADGLVLVARQGRRIPQAYLAAEGIAEHAITAIEFETAVAAGELELTALTRADRAARDFAAPITTPDAPPAEDDEIDEDPELEVDDVETEADAAKLPAISRMVRYDLIAELVERDADFDPEAHADVLRDELRAAREQG